MSLTVFARDLNLTVGYEAGARDQTAGRPGARSPDAIKKLLIGRDADH